MRASTCSSCGTRQEEWTADEYAYVGHIWRCKGCEVIEQERANVPDDAGRGIHVGIIPRHLAEQQEAQQTRKG